MDNVEKFFRKEDVENVSQQVKEKMDTLRQIKDFKQIDDELLKTIDEFEQNLTDELKEKLNLILKLTYQVEDYYFMLAYLLGKEK